MYKKTIMLESVAETEALSVSATIETAKKEFPNKRNIKWPKNIKIGWWEDKQNVIMFHGTHYTNLLGILETGIYAPKSGPTAGWVSMAFDPNTAHGYASMGGESAFRAAGSSARHIPEEERIVLVTKFPMSFVKQNMEKDYRGNVPYTRNRLINRHEYEAWDKSDEMYYALTEIRFPVKIELKYIIGYTRKKK